MVNDQLGGMGLPLWYVRNGQTVANGGRAPVSSNRPLLSVTNTFRSRAMHAAGPVCINQLSVRLLPYAKALTTLASKYWRVAPSQGSLLERQGMGTENFLFIWRHKDGSIVTFSPKGWSSTNSEQQTWLNAMNHLTSSVPAIAPLVRMWIQENCHLVEGHGPDL
jgi:hypothetical protein